MNNIDFRQAWRNFFSYNEYDETPHWLRLLLTVLFSMGVAVPFTLLGIVLSWGRGNVASPMFWLQQYGESVVVALAIGLAIYACFFAMYAVLGPERIAKMSFRQRRVVFSIVPLVGLAIGWPIGLMLIGVDFLAFFGAKDSGQLLRVVILMALIAFVFNIIFANKARAIEAERAATEAQLRLLQGQMEPHFMFNTLANVLGLMDSDVPRARQLLEAFIDYLRSSLTRLRAGETTLGDELTLAESYLGLMQMRMGERLAFRFEVAEPSLRRAAIPPLLLQPLVENAIRHGLECKVEGGTVVVRVRRDDGRLVVEVEDDGCGASAQPVRRVGVARGAGNGVALENARARLRSRYGDAASLELVLRPDAGALATLTLPIHMSPAAAA